MIKLKNKAGNDIYFNVLNIISITDRKGGVLIKTSNPACNVEVTSVLFSLDLFPIFHY